MTGLINPTPSHRSLPGLRGSRILIVDDHPFFSSGLAQALYREGIAADVATAVNVAAAIADLQRHPDTEMILLDLALQDEEGLALLHELDVIGLPVPVVVISSRDDDDAVQMAEAAGASGFLCKSANAELFLKTLLRIRAGHTCFPMEAFRRPALSLQLTSRQREVLGLLADGLPNKAICRALDLSEHTVKSHLKAIFSILEVHNRTECVRAARRLGLVG